MAVDLAEVRAFNSGPPGPQAAVEQIADQLTGRARKLYVEALDDPGIEASAIGRWLETKHQIVLDAQAVRRYRQRKGIRR